MEVIDTCYFQRNGGESSKLAMFDLDSTLIKTKSGRKFPKDAKDWQPLYEHVPVILRQLVEDGWRLVIFTNQSGISRKPEKLKSITKKLKRMQKKWKVGFDIFIASDKDIYRKPCTGMWKLLDVNYDEAFYCGDAAGREGDFSDSDKNFAHNIGVKFRTPEWMFDVSVSSPIYKSTNPLEFAPFEVENVEYQEIVVLIGEPGCGKSRFAKHYFPEYGYINRDTLRTANKCIKVAKKYILNGESIIIDNTNATEKERERYEFEDEDGDLLPIRYFWFNYPKEWTKYFNHYRVEMGEREKLVPDVVYHTFRKRLVLPEKVIEIDKLIDYGDYTFDSDSYKF